MSIPGKQHITCTGWHVTVATLFTSTVPDPTGFALACQTDKGLAADVDYMALRRAEDVAACALIGAEPLHLPFAEAPHRGYGSAAALFAGLHEANTIVGDLGPALDALIGQIDPDLILLPQAIGAHVDHVALVEAEQTIDSRAERLWWRDHPYVTRTADPKQPFARRFDAMHEVDSRFDATDLEAKTKAAIAYASQIGFQFGGATRLTENLSRVGQVEHFRSRAASIPSHST